MQNILWGKCQENTINFPLPKNSFIYAGLGRFFMGAAMGGLLPDTNHTAFSLCFLHKNKFIKLTLIFVNENFIIKSQKNTTKVYTLIVHKNSFENMLSTQIIKL